jgi:hypothetical protein
MIGALHGHKWVPSVWWSSVLSSPLILPPPLFFSLLSPSPPKNRIFGLFLDINDTGRGRTYCVNIAKQLAALDLHAPVLDEEEKNFPLQPPPKKEVKTENSDAKPENSEVKTESEANKNENGEASVESTADALSELSVK